MKWLIKGLLILCILMHFFGCAGLMKDQLSDAQIADRCLTRALEYEKEGELQKALYHLKIAGTLAPGDKQAAERIISLQAIIDRKSEKHFKRGIALFKKDQIIKARTELLIALRYDPFHEKAIEYLKSRLVEKDFVRYKVKKGDTVETIALEVYKDFSMDFLVASFMSLDKKGPAPGSVIKLPFLVLESPAQPMNVKTKLTEAQNFFKEKKYEKALSTVQEILEHDPESKEALDLKNVSFFRLGKRLALKRKYPESLEMFRKVDPEYEDIKETIFDAKANIAKQAELHYRKGVKSFLNEDLENAVMEWGKTLTLYPDHKKAKRDIENARRLLEKLETIR